VTIPSPGALPRGETGTEPPLVLIVDDNRKNLKLARDVLRAAGLRTLEAETGAEGMALAAEHLPDVILMDLRLPDMDGTDAVRTLREAERTARIPVVALSALPFDGDGDWLLAAGFAGYLEKPIRIGEFPDQVRGYCARTAG
jgi:two-component system cell cycle response regulator DivK